MEIVKLPVTASWGHLVLLVRERESILFSCYHVKLGCSQNSYNTPVGFTLTLDTIHGTRREFTVKLTSEIILKRGQFSIIIEGSKLTRLIGTGLKMLSTSSKTIKLRVLKSEY